MRLKNIVVPGILLFIGFSNILIALWVSEYPLYTAALPLLGIFFVFAVMTYLQSGKNVILSDNVSELTPHLVFDLPKESRFIDLQLRRRKILKELTGTFTVAGEKIRVQITHMLQEDLASQYRSTQDPDEKLLQEMREEDEHSLNIKQVEPYHDLQVNGEPIPAYTALVEGERDARPVVRGIANLDEHGILSISIAAHSREGLKKTSAYLAKLKT